MAKNVSQRVDQVEQEISRLEDSRRSELESFRQKLEQMKDLPARVEHLIRLQEEMVQGGLDPMMKMKGPAGGSSSPKGDSNDQGDVSNIGCDDWRCQSSMDRIQMGGY